MPPPSGWEPMRRASRAVRRSLPHTAAYCEWLATKCRVDDIRDEAEHVATAEQILDEMCCWRNEVTTMSVGELAIVDEWMSETRIWIAKR